MATYNYTADGEFHMYNSLNVILTVLYV